MKSIALFGGSFNPPHPGHFEMARNVYKNLGVNEIWFLFSQNPDKDASKYAPVEQRMEMGRILALHYPDLPFIPCDLEEDIGSHRTYDILTVLKEKYPDDKFIWVMGADNLDKFHTWGNYEKIIEGHPIAVFDRKKFSDAARNSVTSLKYEFLKVADPKQLKTLERGWSFMKVEKVDFSSSDLISELQSGQTEFPDPFQEVADYIIRNGLYQTDVRPRQVPDPAFEIK